MNLSSNQLKELFTKKLTPQDMLSLPDIMQSIKTQIQKFTDLLLQYSDFTKNMITLSLKTSSQKLENLKSAAYVAVDILTSDHQSISDLFIQCGKPRIQLYEDDQDFVCQQIDDETGQTIYVQRKEVEDQNESQFQRKFKYLMFMLEYLSEEECDENCINYIAKVLSTLCRSKTKEMYEFFIEKEQILNLIIKNASKYPSLSLFISKLICESEDSAVRSYKQKIFSKVIAELKNNIDSPNFSIYMEFVEEIFSKNKFRTDEPEEIKTVSQILVDQVIINWMVQTLKKGYEENNCKSVSNCVLYLLTVVQRMNLDDQEDPYSYSPTNKQPTMNFQVESIYLHFDEIVKMTQKINRCKYEKYAILQFYQFLTALIKNKRFTQAKINKNVCIVSLLKAYSFEHAQCSGLIQSRIVQLIEKMISFGKERQNSEELTNLINQLHNLTNSVENQCFSDKISIVLLNQFSNISKNHYKTYQKYKGLLGPKEFTSKRVRNSEQLSFSQKNKYLDQNKKNIILSDEQEQELQQPEELPLNNNFKIFDSQDSIFTSPSIQSPINLNLINKKIMEIKSKKSNQKKNQTNDNQMTSNNNETNNKNQTQNKIQNGGILKIEETKNEEKTNLMKIQQQINYKQKQLAEEKKVQKCGPIKKEEITFFGKHLILF